MVDLKAAVRLQPPTAEAIGLGRGDWCLLVCEDHRERFLRAGEATLAEIFGYLDLGCGETITVQPQTFHLMRHGWPSPKDFRIRPAGRRAGASPEWGAAPGSAEVAVVSTRVGLLLECLRQYAGADETAERSTLLADMEAIVGEWSNVEDLDLDAALQPLGGEARVSCYEASYLVFQALAAREGELEALELAIAAAGLPPVQTGSRLSHRPVD